MSENYARIIEMAKKQEALLRFDHFSNLDAWALGSFLVQRVFDQQIDMALCIRKLNGNIIFQYATQNTTLSNQQWMQRKFNTVCLTEGSSLRAWATSELKGQSLADQGISSADYAFCGGGFPIRLKSGELVAALIVSNLPHKEDHGFIVSALSEWLNIADVPIIL
ncbi:MAG: heme-binding protein [Clostridia bacterium]|nr:heme-binding protein [Clostridia bacterium]